MANTKDEYPKKSNVKNSATKKEKKQDEKRTQNWLNNFCKSQLRLDKEDTYIVTFKDAELDPVKAKFHYDNCIEIDTKGYTYITLTEENLYEMINYISVTQELYDDRHKEEMKKFKDGNYEPLEMD